MKSDRIVGSVLGLALGDAFGAPYEGGVLERLLWAVIGTTKGKRRWTDDTQMTLDVVASLIEHGRVDQDDLAHRFAGSYRWSRGYGPAAARILKRIRRGQPWEAASRSVYREGSFGNGGAMRAPAVALFFAEADETELVNAVRDATMVTHGHPLAIEGAVLIGLATAMAYHDATSESIIGRLGPHAASPEFKTRLRRAGKWLGSEAIPAAQAIATKLGNGIAAVDSCLTAIYSALAFRERTFDELLDFVVKVRGDVDTISAMAGAIWGAARGKGALPEARLQTLEHYEELKIRARSLAKAAGNDPEKQSS